MAVYNSHNTKQWEELLNAINGGDTSAIATALETIKSSIDSIATVLSSFSTDVNIDSSQWLNLINAITNQSFNVDLSNITSSIVSNLSNVTGNTVTDALNLLKSVLTELFLFHTVSSSIGMSNGSRGSVTAPDIQGYDFLTWTMAISAGWIGNIYFENPLNKTTNIWSANYGSSIQGKGNITCYALYIRSV